MTGLERFARARNQRAAYKHVAELVEADHEVVISQGNGPQVGNVLRKNEPAADDQSRLVRLSLPEIRRLIALIAWPREPDPAHVIRCSLWRRKHQVGPLLAWATLVLPGWL